MSHPESVAASRSWWDNHADEYQREHGDFLGNCRWIWGPEGLDEAEVGLLGELGGQRLLELGCGAAAGARWAIRAGARAVGLDVSLRQLQHSRRIDAEVGVSTSVVCADAVRLPFADVSFDIVGSAYGALPFVADAAGLIAEVARVLRVGGRFVFSVTHPIRWSFPDVPGEGGLRVNRSYFDRRAYVEEDIHHVATYVEHHRTIGDWVDLVVGAGLAVERLVEPEWPPDLEKEWGGWSRLRGQLIPGTLIVVASRNR